MDEITRDRFIMMTEDSIFLKEEENQQPKSISDGHANTPQTKAKQIATTVANTVKGAALVAVKEARELILKLKDTSEEDQRLIDEDTDAINKICTLGCKYAVCAILFTPILGVIPTIIWHHASKEKDFVKRKKLYTNISADIKMLNARIADLENNPNPSEAEKTQKYKLIQLREKLTQNSNKLRATLQFGEG